MSQDIVVYFPENTVPDDVLQGIYNNRVGTSWYGGFPWHDYGRIEAAWKCMNRQPKLWIGEDTEPIAQAIDRIVGTTGSQKVDIELIKAVESTFLSLQPGPELNKMQVILETLDSHFGDRVCSTYE